MIDHLIVNGCLAQGEGSRATVFRGWVAVAQDRILSVEPGDAPEGLQRNARRIIDAAGCIVLPGLVNAHTHLSQTFMRGLASDKLLSAWLSSAIQPLQAGMTADDLHLASLLGMVENLHCGVTTIVQHHKITTTREHVEATLHAARSMGIRMLLARGWRDSGPRGEGADSIDDEMRYLARAWDCQAMGRIRIGFGPMSPGSCSTMTMRRMAARADEFGFPTHIHIAETTEEVDRFGKKTGMSQIRWLETTGALRPGTQLVHCVHVDDDDLDLISSHGAAIVHCPVSNMRLASGIAPLRKMIDRGICVCLGTDGSASNDTQDLLETMKTAALLANVVTGNAGAVPPGILLSMVTQAGADALGWREIGRLAPEMKADLAIFDMDTPRAMPVHNPLQGLVYSASGIRARHVLVDGNLLLENGRATMLDEASLTAACARAAGDLFSRAGVYREGTMDRILPHVPAHDMESAG